MEATPAPPTSTDPSPGELLLLNGRLGGTRQPLAVPLTAIGSQPGCDVRLDVEGVEELHCVIGCGPQGLVLRDLQSQSGTFLNGERVQNRQLCDGDFLTVGPFQFKVRLNPDFLYADLLNRHTPATQVPPIAEALLTQAAAVAAQQSALGEEEVKLLQRRQALEQQERQLAEHLEEKRQRLVQLTEQTQVARVALQAERTAHARHVEESRRSLEETQGRLAETKQRAEAERVRFRALRRRLKLRWQRHLKAERENFRRREEALAEEGRQLERESIHIREARNALTQAQLKWNGEAELGRRHLQDERDRLGTEQLAWQEARRREQEALTRREAELDRWETELADLGRRLVVEGRQNQKLRVEREREAEGLENRIRNLRRKLGEHEDALARNTQPAVTLNREGPADSTATQVVRPALPISQLSQVRLAVLGRAAENLADQRFQLLELWQTLTNTEQSWQSERAELLSDLEALGGRLLEREQDIRLREEVLKNREELVEQHREEVVVLRQQQESRQLRLHTRQTNWEGERDRLLAELQSKELLAERQLAGLVELRERWLKRRRQEVLALQSQRGQYEKLRQEAAALHKEWLSRSASLEDLQRTVAEQALVLEQFRQETLGQAPDAVAAERALEKHRRRWLNENGAALRSLKQQRQAAQAEMARLDERLREWQRQAQALHAQEAEFAERRVLWEHEQEIVESQQAALRLEVERSRKQRAAYERQIAQLRDEVDRVAEVLLNEGNNATKVAPPLAA
jgi:pSer/pThr/pTyr-binding forkhead associated (FHA) protein